MNPNPPRSHAKSSGGPKSRFRLVVAVLMLVSIFSIAGCGGSGFGPIGEISGTLKMDGKPVPEGTKIIFMHPADGHAGFGLTDVEGNFTIEWRRAGTTYNGLPIGTYEVMIVESSSVSVDELTADEMLAGKAPDARTRTLIPRKYLRATTSGLRYEVQKGKNAFDVSISSKD